MSIGVRKCMHTDIHPYSKLHFGEEKYIEFFNINNGRVRYIPLPGGLRDWSVGCTQVKECTLDSMVDFINVTIGGIPNV